MAILVSHGEKINQNGHSWSPRAIWQHLHNLGYNLIPICRGTRKPLTEWKQWQTERRPLEIDNGVDYALLTGLKPYSSAPALAIADGDDPEAVAQIERLCQSTPFVVETTRGRHFYFRRPENIDYLPQRIGTWIDGKLYKIDIKCDGNFVMAPGSRGKEWSQPLTPELIASLPVYDPNWFPPQPKTERVSSSSREVSVVEVDFDYKTRLAREWLATRPGAQQGKGNGADNYCFAIAMQLLHGFDLDEETAIELLLEWGERDDQIDANGLPFPWKLQEIRHKINSASVEVYDGTRGDLLPFAAQYETVDRICTPFDAAEPCFGDSYTVPLTRSEEPDELDDLLTLSQIRARALTLKDSKLWAAEKWFQVGKLCLLSGKAKRGKSTCVFDLTASVASGTKWLNLVPTNQMPVLLFDYENEEDYHWDNFDSMLSAKGVSAEAVERYLYIIDPSRIAEKHKPFTVDKAIARIKKIQATTGIMEGLFVVDTARPAFNDLSDTPDWEWKPSPVRKALDLVRAVIAATGWGGVVIHHNNKSDNGPSGSGDWEGAVDYAINYELNLKTGVSSLRWIGRQTEPPGQIDYRKQDGALIGEYHGEQKKKKEADEVDLLKVAILTALAGGDRSTEEVIVLVKNGWTETAECRIPGNNKIRGTLAQMANDGELKLSVNGGRGRTKTWGIF